MPQSEWRKGANRGAENKTKCKWDVWEQIGALSQHASCVYVGTMALFVFVLDMCKEDGGIFAVCHGPEPEEVYAASLADLPPTFRVVRIYQ